MGAFATFPVLIPVFRTEWGISNTQAGSISGLYYGGYVAAVAVLTALTDRIAAKRIYLASMAVSAVAAGGFALFAAGMWTASACQFLQGVGLAGTYMPGLRALTDGLPERLQSRGTALYTASFSIGSSASFYLSGQFGAALGWQWAFALCALGPLAGAATRVDRLRVAARAAANGLRPGLLDFRPVLRNRRALGFTLAYTVHNVELFAFRSWVVAFFVFSQAQHGPDALGVAWSAATIVGAHQSRRPAVQRAHQ